MIYHFAVKSVEQIDSACSFAEWTNTSDEHAEADVERWQDAYYAGLAEALQEFFPGTDVTVGEGNDLNAKCWIRLVRVDSETPDTYDIDLHDGDDGREYDWAEQVAEEKVKDDIDFIVDRYNNTGKFWEA